MSGGHFDYEGHRARDWFEKVAQDRDVRLRWPGLSLLFEQVGKVLLEAEHAMDWDLSGDSSLTQGDAEFENSIRDALVDALDTEVSATAVEHIRKRAQCEALGAATSGLAMCLDDLGVSIYDLEAALDGLRCSAVLALGHDLGIAEADLPSHDYGTEESLWARKERVTALTRTAIRKARILEKAHAAVGAMRRELGGGPEQDSE